MATRHFFSGIADILTLGATAQDRHIKMGCPKGSAFVGISLKEAEQFLAHQEDARLTQCRNEGRKLVHALCESTMSANEIERARTAFVQVLLTDRTGVSAQKAYDSTADIWREFGKRDGRRFINSAVDLHNDCKEPERTAYAVGVMEVQIIPG